MPLAKGASEKAIAKNIEEMEASGHSHEQAVAAAMHNADQAKKKRNNISRFLMAYGLMLQRK